MDLVDASTGNYVADVSISWGETLVLKADGAYTMDFAAVSGARRIRAHEAGKYILEDEVLTMTPTTGEGKPTVRRVWGLRATADGRGRVLVVSSYDDTSVSFTTRSSGQSSGTWYRLER
jgi:hypothetical protein